MLRHRVVHFVLAWMLSWFVVLILTANLALAAFQMGFPTAGLFVWQPLWTGVIALTLTTLIAALNQPHWRGRDYWVMGGALGMMASVFVGGWLLNQAPGADEILTVIFVTTYGVMVGGLIGHTYRITRSGEKGPF